MFTACPAKLPTDLTFARAGRDEYVFNVAASRLRELIRGMTGGTRPTDPNFPNSDRPYGVSVEFVIPWHCSDGLLAPTYVLPGEVANTSSIILMRLYSSCLPSGWSSSEMKQLFEDSVIASLRRQVAP